MKRRRRPRIEGGNGRPADCRSALASPFRAGERDGRTSCAATCSLGSRTSDLDTDSFSNGRIPVLLYMFPRADQGRCPRDLQERRSVRVAHVAIAGADGRAGASLGEWDHAQPPDADRRPRSPDADWAAPDSTPTLVFGTTPPAASRKDALAGHDARAWRNVVCWMASADSRKGATCSASIATLRRRGSPALRADEVRTIGGGQNIDTIEHRRSSTWAGSSLNMTMSLRRGSFAMARRHDGRAVRWYKAGASVAVARATDGHSFSPPTPAGPVGRLHELKTNVGAGW